MANIFSKYPVSGGGSGANTNLSNLASPTSVNQSLIPSTSLSNSLGGPSSVWLNTYSSTLVGSVLAWTGSSGAGDLTLKSTTNADQGWVRINDGSGFLFEADPTDLAETALVDFQGSGVGAAMITSTSNTGPALSLYHAGSNTSVVAGGSSLSLINMDGTFSSPTSLTSGQVVSALNSFSYAGGGDIGAPALVGTIAVLATENHGTANLGTKMVFQNRLNGSHAQVTNVTIDQNGDLQANVGSVAIETVGKGLQVKGGAGGRVGTVALTAGSATVANTTVTANTIVLLSVSSPGGTRGFLSYSVSVGTGFTITSSAAETSTVAYMLVEQL